ncbi:MAG: DNA polymerase III subunit alpha [Bacteroidota bacterium]|nr:DNA polymerase III subunit alpha [Bacteroidota bacterium]
MYLNCHSYHSLRYGTIPVEELVQLAKDCKVSALALTDINTVTGVYDFILKCQANNIKPLVGIEFRTDNKLLYIGLAKNTKGFAELCKFLTEYNLSNTPLPIQPPVFKDVVIIYPFKNVPTLLQEYEYIGLRPEDITKLIRAEWKDRIDKMVIYQPITYRTKKEYNLHKILRAMDINTLLSKLTVDDQARVSDKMIPIDDLLAHYIHFSVVISNTENIIEQCNFEFDFNTPKNKKYYTNSRESDKLLLTNLAMEGLERRYGKNNKEALARVQKELKVIDDLRFSGYFLITWDIIRYSQSRGFLHIGRGSGANSIVSYCLGITDICPIELNLYFERFLNPSRASPPDFDIDWSWKDRDEILNYIFNRFGAGHVAFTGTIVEFKHRSIIREIGKVFGLAKEEMDKLAKSSADSHDKNSIVNIIHEYGMLLEKYPNQRSMHSCGILISEEPITNYTALEMPPKGFPIVQFNMHIAEDIGFEKFDILSQRGIGHINDCVKLVEQNQGIKVDIRNVLISKDEAKANEYLREGKTLGCFYIESPAMRGLLRKLKCDNYKTLVAASSVIRPGVAQSGMMGEYVFRHNNPTKFEYFHRVFEEQLGDTYGVMVYQEDVIKIAHHFADLDLADADILRRAMSGKTRSKKEFEGVRNRFFENCKIKGYPDQLAQEVYRQIESFAGYSFCKAHSASYAVESYQSLYLKVYYPIEFMVAVINNFGGFYRTEIYFHEAKMAGATICCPCVNRSEHLTTLYDKDIYMGFVHLKSLPAQIGTMIPEERMKNGDYKSLEDFINRIPIGIETLQILIYIGAFRFTGNPDSRKDKNELILLARMLLANYKPENRTPLLLHEPIKEYTLPTLQRSPFEDAFDEIELLDFPVSCSPFDLLKTEFRGDVKTSELIYKEKQIVRMVGYLISIKHVPTKRGMMNFGTWIDAEGGYFDTTHFADSLARYPFKGGGCYLLLGKVDIDFGFASIVIEKMAKLPFVPDPRYEDDKDMSYKVHQQMREDISTTHRAPYPTESEIGLPRFKMMVD